MIHPNNSNWVYSLWWTDDALTSYAKMASSPLFMKNLYVSWTKSDSPLKTAFLTHPKKICQCIPPSWRNFTTARRTVDPQRFKMCNSQDISTIALYFQLLLHPQRAIFQRSCLTPTHLSPPNSTLHTTHHYHLQRCVSRGIGCCLLIFFSKKLRA